MIEVRETALAGVLEIRTQRFSDERGFFSETWNEEAWREAGIALKFVQDNHSLSRSPGVLRGLHFQRPPQAQDKLVRVTRGSVYDVAVDIRRTSPTFGQWVGVTLSSEAWNQLLIPRGFAHGFVTLEPDTEVQYKVTAPYSPEHDRCVRFDDPAIGVDWPMQADQLTLSDKDRAAPALADVDTGF
jgi:dTDP-4-dehydrorhamnose 3,5-epimerase